VGSAPLKPSSDATMMVVTYGEHQAYALRVLPTAPRYSGGGAVYRGPDNTADPAGSWYCSKTRRIRPDCRKRSKVEAAARGGKGPVAGGQGHNNADAYVGQEQAPLVFLADATSSNSLQALIGDVILGIVATSTIAGAACVVAYTARLPASTRSAITSVDATAVFKFGGDNTQRSYKRVTVPLVIGSEPCYVNVWVVAGGRPMLLSQASMASFGVVLDVAACTMVVEMLGKTAIPVAMSKAGHLTFNALGRRREAGAATPRAVIREVIAPTHAKSASLQGFAGDSVPTVALAPTEARSLSSPSFIRRTQASAAAVAPHGTALVHPPVLSKTASVSVTTATGREPIAACTLPPVEGAPSRDPKAPVRKGKGTAASSVSNKTPSGGVPDEACIAVDRALADVTCPRAGVMGDAGRPAAGASTDLPSHALWASPSTPSSPRIRPTSVARPFNSISSSAAARHPS